MKGSDESTLAYLQARRFGPAIIDRFFRPFLGGIFLDPDLATSSRMLRFVFRMFSSGDALVPARGTKNARMNRADVICSSPERSRNLCAKNAGSVSESAEISLYILNRAARIRQLR